MATTETASMLKIEMGNSFWLKVALTKKLVGGGEEALDVSSVGDMAVSLTQAGRPMKALDWHASGDEVGVIYVHIPETLRVGVYGFDITGKIGIQPWRSAELYTFRIVFNNASTNVTPNVYEGENCYDVDMTFQLYTGIALEVDEELTATGTNPVEGKAVYEKVKLATDAASAAEESVGQMAVDITATREKAETAVSNANAAAARCEEATAGANTAAGVAYDKAKRADDAAAEAENATSAAKTATADAVAKTTAAEEAAAAAKKATEETKTATTAARNATDAANKATETSNATTAENTAKINAAVKSAGDATDKANAAARQADASAGKADVSAENADSMAAKAEASAQKADASAAKADEAAASVNEAKTAATEAAEKATAAAKSAETAAAKAQTAADNATAAADAAKAQTTAAKNAADSANSAASAAKTATDNADAATANAKAAATASQTQTEACKTATEEANSATEKANTAAENAASAADDAAKKYQCNIPVHDVGDIVATYEGSFNDDGTMTAGSVYKSFLLKRRGDWFVDNYINTHTTNRIYVCDGVDAEGKMINPVLVGANIKTPTDISAKAGRYLMLCRINSQKNYNDFLSAQWSGTTIAFYWVCWLTRNEEANLREQWRNHYFKQWLADSQRTTPTDRYLNPVTEKYGFTVYYQLTNSYFYGDIPNTGYESGVLKHYSFSMNGSPFITAPIETKGITDMGYMFSGCSSLQSLDVSGWDTAQVTNMGYVFSGCSSLQSLDVSGWDTAQVTIMGSMFSGCSSLQSLDVSGWDTAQVTNMGYMFSSCSSLQSLDVSGWDTAQVTGMGYMFYGCSSLQSIGLCAIPKGCDTSNMFLRGGGKLTTIPKCGKISATLDLRALRALTRESALRVINALDAANAGTLTLSNPTYALLTDDDKAIATSKNWEIASA